MKNVEKSSQRRYPMDTLVSLNGWKIFSPMTITIMRKNYATKPWA